MTYLLLTIVFSSLIFVIFKWFSKFEIDNVQAITVNYFIASGLGAFMANDYNLDKITHSDWSIPAFTLGGIFICLFYLIAVTAQKVGVAVATVANKMSVIFPVMFAFLFLGDSVTAIKLIGISMVLIGVYLTVKKDSETAIDKKKMLLPILLFVGNGILETTLNWAQNAFVPADETAIFVSTIFASAGTVGVLLFIFNKSKFQFKNIIAGIGLGVPNYLSIYFFVKTLSQPEFESSYIFPIVNIGVVMFTTALAILFFKEKLTRTNLVGIAIAIIAICTMSFA